MLTERSFTETSRGTTFAKDPETGMLYTRSLNGFNIERKKKFLELAEKHWPNISLICDVVGISKKNYEFHRHYDPVFNERCEQLYESRTDAIEAALAKFALEKSNFMDRMAWLRAHRGEKYNEKKMLQVDISLSPERAEAKKEMLSRAIDTSVVTDAELVQSIGI